MGPPSSPRSLTRVGKPAISEFSRSRSSYRGNRESAAIQLDDEIVAQLFGSPRPANSSSISVAAESSRKQRNSAPARRLRWERRSWVLGRRRTGRSDRQQTVVSAATIDCPSRVAISGTNVLRMIVEVLVLAEKKFYRAGALKRCRSAPQQVFATGSLCRILLCQCEPHEVENR